MTPQRRRLAALIDYVQQSARARTKVVANVTDHGLFLLFEHQLAGLDGARLNEAGDDGQDGIWLSVPRPPGPSVPPGADNAWLAPWLAVGIALLVAPKLLDTVDGAALIAGGTHRDASVPASSMEDMIKPAVLPNERIALAAYEFRSEVEKQFAAYLESAWVPWADAERRRRRLSRLYVQLFTLQQQLAGSLVEAPVELVWGLGLGVVSQPDTVDQKPGAALAYPLITRLVDLSLNPRTGAVEVRPRDADPCVELDFYASLDKPGMARPSIARAEQAAREALAQAATDPTPFDPASYEPALTAVRDAFSFEGKPRPTELALEPPEAGEPLPPLKISRSWVLFARPRSTNLMVQDLERFRRALDELDASEPLPEAVAALVTDPATEPVRVELPRFRGVSAPYTQRGTPLEGSAADLYFPKPFNDEQVRIVQLLEAHDGVAVQGPPGTGKTHTIANIICHWLATGRRVLVTSMKEPALAVLRDKLPAEIQPLAISLLGSEHEGLQQFERSIQTIASEVQGIDHAALAREVAQLEETIDGLHTRLTRIDTEIGRWARLNQSRIDIDGESLSPMEAAQEVIDRARQYEWLPDPLGIGPQYAPRFGEEDIARLREARRQVGRDLDYVGRELPSLAELPDARALLHTHQGLVRIARMSALSAADRPQLAGALLATGGSDLRDLTARIERVKALREDIAHAGSAWVGAMRARVRSGAATEELALLEALGRELQQAAQQRKAFLSRPVAAAPDAEIDAEFVQAVENLAEGRRAFGLMGFGKSEVKRALDAVRVSGQPPADAGEWRQVLDYLNLQRRWRALNARWNALAPELGLEPVRAGEPQDGAAAAAQFALYRKVRLLADTETELAQHAARAFPAWQGARRVAEDAAALDQLERTLAHQQLAHQLGEVWVSKARLQQALEGRSGRIVNDLRVFVSDVLGNAKVDESDLLGQWSALMAELARLHRLAPALQTIADVTQRIAQSGAPQYAQRLLQPGEGGEALLPAGWRRAWRTRSLASHLALIDPQDEFRKLTRLRGDLENDLARAYDAVVVKRTWLKLAENATPSVRAALQAYLNAIQRIGKGTGKRAARYRQDARNAAAEANAAVPCWIMPHYRVSETLPARLGCFDLVVIDEASQSDLTALPAMFRGRKLLIVGDDKQVSPEGVGLEEERIKALMQRHLAEQVPVYRAQMSPDRSIYDLAKVVFARSGVMLKEHFRCVAPIIEYSKREFYQHELQPLRLPPAPQRLDPPLIDVLVQDGARKGDVNAAEVRFIVEEAKRLLADPRMAQRSIGVVSLLGDSQALAVWNALTEELGPETLQRHQIACGDARTFQGKERDVMFLSMVCAPNDVGAPLAREAFAQRFNVAASRARDRMYLVRSVELGELSEADRLRRGLIAHFAQPFADQAAQPGNPRELCESPLEREVYDWLTERGYRVRPQVRVGSYRIDLVVEGAADARLAVECDGDKYHGPDKWTADVRRQRVLERVGWSFWRCFASTFVRRREAVLEDLAATLAARGIQPASLQPHAPIEYAERRPVRVLQAVG